MLLKLSSVGFSEVSIVLSFKCKGVDLYSWLGGGMIGAKIFSAMDQSNQEVEACGRLHPPPPPPKRVARISF